MLTCRRLGEATDHFAQTEVEELDLALKDAEGQSSASDDGSREFGTSPKLSTIKSLLARVPGAGDLVQQAGHLQTQSDVQQELNRSQLEDDINSRAPKSESGPPGSNVPGTSMDPVKLSSQIYPILEFRDTVVKLVANTIEKIPGLEALVEKINDMLTLFVLSLLARTYFRNDLLRVVTVFWVARNVSRVYALDKSHNSNRTFDRKVLTPRSLFSLRPSSHQCGINPT